MSRPMSGPQPVSWQRGIPLLGDHASSLRRVRRFVPPLYTCYPITSLATSTRSAQDYEDFYRYTGGRWLWDEEMRLRDRYQRFNVPELKRIAAGCRGAETCVSMTKIAEGGFNKVFRLVMDNGSTVIARIPYPNAGPSFKSTASEVATMDFALTVLELPVPKVLCWCGRMDNPVESEYILMEEAVGTQLAEIWDDMELESKLNVVEDVVSVEKKLLSLSFTRFGNLYFTKDAFTGCEKAEVVGNVPQRLKEQVANRFVIGPVADKSFWYRERAYMNIDRGPWSRPQDYLK